jgi:hypothetical protein
MLKGEERFANGERNGPVDHFEQRTPRAQASGRTALRNAALELNLNGATFFACLERQKMPGAADHA